MISLADADLFVTIATVVLTLTLLTSFSGAIFLEKRRPYFAIITGITAVLLLVIMGFALASPYMFSP
ncbi:MAG: hypothetical protein EU536_04965 [Promethearchaeota archaeon]|nr:MAG: hypothetical protein EU536_04965 [Candidatus Lokiarchaeota archaeon]